MNHKKKIYKLIEKVKRLGVVISDYDPEIDIIIDKIKEENFDFIVREILDTIRKEPLKYAGIKLTAKELKGRLINQIKKEYI